MVGNIVIFAIALAVVLLIVKLIGKSIKALIGIVINGILGFVILLILKAIGFGVAVNWMSALICGILGIPGLIIVLVLQLGFHILL